MCSRTRTTQPSSREEDTPIMPSKYTPPHMTEKIKDAIAKVVQSADQSIRRAIFKKAKALGGFLTIYGKTALTEALIDRKIGPTRARKEAHLALLYTHFPKQALWLNVGTKGMRSIAEVVETPNFSAFAR